MIAPIRTCFSKFVASSDYSDFRGLLRSSLLWCLLVFLAWTCIRQAGGVLGSSSEYDLAVVVSLVTKPSPRLIEIARLYPRVSTKDGDVLAQDEKPRVSRWISSASSRGGFAEVSPSRLADSPRSRGRSFTGQSKLVGWQYVS